MRTSSDERRDVLEQLTNSHPDTYSEVDLHRRAAMEIHELRHKCELYERRIHELELRVVELLKEATR